MTNQTVASPKTQERAWPPPQGQWTHTDWLKLPDDGWRYEVIKGELFMDPAPLEPHQRVSSRLHVAIANFVDARKAGRVYSVPIEVRLGDSPVQPDILFIAQDRVTPLVTRERIAGAPDLIIEIRSPGTWLVDRREKFNLYREYGVREYWIVDPDRCEVEVFALRGDQYELLGKWDKMGMVRSEVLAGFEVNVQDICSES